MVSPNYVFFFLEVSGTRPVAINGVLDLRDYNLNEDKPILLKGEWEFHWNELKEPGSFVNGVSGIPIINVPTAWTNKVIPDGTQLPGTGFATYRLRVLLAKNNKQLAIKLPTTGTAAKLFINGFEELNIGKVGQTKKKETLITDLK